MPITLQHSSESLAQLRAIATPLPDYRTMPFGVDALDRRLSGGGLRASAPHEIAARTCSLAPSLGYGLDEIDRRGSDFDKKA